MGEVESTEGDNELADACARIENDPNPAFVKDSELRYVAVNAAYARMWDCLPALLIGQQSHQHFDSVEQNDRDEKERRSLVFGKDQVALFAHPLKGGRYRVRIHRKRQSTGKTFIIGHFEPIAGVRFETGPLRKAEPDAARSEIQNPVLPAVNIPCSEIAVRGDHKLLQAAIEAAAQPMAVIDGSGRIVAESHSHKSATGPWRETPLPDGGMMRWVAPDKASQHQDHSEPQSAASDISMLNRFNEIFDRMDVGIVLYDPDDVLLYVNPAMDAITAPDYRLEVGQTLQSILEITCSIDAEKDPDARSAWIEKRIFEHRECGKPTVEQLKNGRWLRIVNRSLNDGCTLGLRIDVTNLKEREAALESKVAENEMFRAILDEMPVSSFVKDEAYRYTYVNRAHGQLTGIPREDMIGQDDYSMFGEHGQALRDVDIKVMNGNEVIESDADITNAKGEQLKLIDRKVCFTDPGGRRYLLGTTIDVSEMKRREEEVFDARRLAEINRSDLESVIDAMHMGVVVVDREHHVELINDAFFRIWKIQPEDAYIGAPFRRLIDVNRHNGIYEVAEENFEEYVEARLEEIREGYVEPREFARADNRTMIYSVRALSEGKRMISYFDVTELKQREKELVLARAETERAGDLLSGAAGAMAQGLLVTSQEKIQFSNDAFMEMLGVSPEVIAPGNTLDGYFAYCQERGDYGDEENAKATRAMILKNHREGIAHSLERQAVNGRWLRIDAKPTANQMMIVTYTDITEAKTREDELKELLGKAEIADRAKSEFLANMSHEIRTPMNGVLGMAELLSRTEMDTRQRTFTDIIVKSGNALLTIINDILDFSKIDAGQMVLDEATFDIREAIEDVATLVSSRAAEKDIELIVRIDPEIPARVIGDMGRMRQIITNLAGNAIKFTEAGHVLIELTGTVNADQALEMKLRVQDTGIGIPKDKLQAVFEQFSQVDNSSTRRHEGTGLGLAITSRLVSLMNGRISVDSVDGEGSVFTVEIALPVDANAAPVRIAPIDVTGSRVLVIDDNAVNRAILNEQLTAWGFDACAAVSGQEGIEVLKAAAEFAVPVDAIILDYHMPDMDGVMTARLIRQNFGADYPPIIMLTSMDIKSSDTDIRSSIVQATLMKPARSSLLLETIVEVLQVTAQSQGKVAPRAGAGLKTAGGGIPALAQSAPAQASKQRPDQSRLRDQGQPAPVRNEASPHSHLDVLVAEDNEVNQIVFTQILEEFGVRYQIADNGGSAFELWKSHRPSMVLMDVSMPVMNGHQATQAIRKAEAEDSRLGRTPVIGVTAHALTGDKERCLEAGMDDYLSKPISPEKLEAKIREWLPAEISARINQG